MSFEDLLIKNNSNKYETIIENRVLGKEINNKIKQYNSIQDEYDKLIYKQNINRKPPTGGWSKINGTLKQISASGKDYLWGVNTNDNIFKCKKPCNDSNWEQVGGSLTQVTGGDKEVWGVNSSGNIYKMNQDGTGNWKQIKGWGTNISQGGGYVWEVGKSTNTCEKPIYYGDKLVISADSSSDSCGLYGCRVACMKDRMMKFHHVASTNENPDFFYINPSDISDIGKVIKYGDPIVLSIGMNFTIGPSSTNTKTIELPQYGMTVHPTPINKQNPRWSDTFSTSVNGNKLTVTRIDANAGWGQKLVLSGSYGNTTNCGMYVCLVARMNSDRQIYFDHVKSLQNDNIFYIQPKINSNERPGDDFHYDKPFVLVAGSTSGNTSNCGMYGCRVGKMIENGNGGSYLYFDHGGTNPYSFMARAVPGKHGKIECNNTYYCKSPCSGDWVKSYNPTNLDIKQLSCNDLNVYGLDTNKHVWWRPINGTDTWKRFGNESQINWQFNWINASSNEDIYGIGMSNKIYKTNNNGTDKWTRADNVATNTLTVSGDSENKDNFYTTNRKDDIYIHTPQKAGGYWNDIRNENYMAGFISKPKTSNDNWKYLGKTKNINDCKLKAVEDENNSYSSIVYNTTTDGAWKNTCYGGIKGGDTNPQYHSGITTSLAPNGTSRLGGDEGEKLLNKMKKFQNEIKSLINNFKKENVSINKKNNLITKNKKHTNYELEQLTEKLDKDRKEINKLLRDSSAIGEEQDSDFRQETNYMIYILWIILVIVSIFLTYHIINTDSNTITPVTYIFIGIWILIFIKYYYKQVVAYGMSYGITALNYVSSFIVDPI
jgi:hypothetical protein